MGFNADVAASIPAVEIFGVGVGVGVPHSETCLSMVPGLLEVCMV